MTMREKLNKIYKLADIGSDNLAEALANFDLSDNDYIDIRNLQHNYIFEPQEILLDIMKLSREKIDLTSVKP